jgi:autotransporter passenger strand-loop-strand repeat protein
MSSDAGLLLGAGGLVSSATIESGGLEIINSGGTNVGASVSGTLRVFSSGLASGVEVHSGGLLRVGALGFGAGGLVSGTTIDSGGLELVDSGGTDFSATISASAALVAFSRGTALDTTISGGTLVVSSGGSLGGKVTFAGSGGTLLIGGTAMPAAVISGFVSGDAIDLPNIPYDSKSGFAALVSGSNKQAVLKIVENKKTYSINLNVVQSPNNMKGQSFQLSSDSSGQGTEIQLMSGGTAGFDAGDYPGDKVMSALWKNTNLSWTMYYLYPAPSRSSRHAQWMGHRQALVNDGWQVVPIYVGQQDPLDPDPAQKNPSGARGVADAMSALAELGPVSSATPLGQGFAPGTT